MFSKLKCLPTALSCDNTVIPSSDHMGSPSWYSSHVCMPATSPWSSFVKHLPPLYSTLQRRHVTSSENAAATVLKVLTVVFAG